MVGVGGPVGAGVLLVLGLAARRLVVLGSTGVHRAGVAGALECNMCLRVLRCRIGVLVKRAPRSAFDCVVPTLKKLTGSRGISLDIFCTSEINCNNSTSFVSFFTLLR